MTTSPVRRQRQPRMPIEVRRQQVLDAALQLITEHGYDAVSVEAIARKADLAKPTVYNAYPGLGPLLQALLEREEARGLKVLADAAAAPVPQQGDVVETLQAWLRHLTQSIAADPGPWRLMLIPPAETPALVREHVQGGRDLALRQVRTLTQAILDANPEVQIDPELAAHAVLASAEHCAKLMLSDPQEYPPERLERFAAELLQALRLI